MNESLPVDYNEFFPDINFSGLTRPTIFILLGCMSIVFPFYVYVYKTNRPKEEKALLFPIINCFYKIMKFTYWITLSLVLAMYYTVYQLDRPKSNIPLINIFVFLIIFLSMCMLYYITQVLHYLISFLAIRKCFVYFFPSTERTIFPILGRFYKRVWILCLFFASKDVMFGISYLIFSCHENCSIYCDILKNSYVGLLIFQNILLLVLLYIPIMLSVRKFSHLPAARENMPEKYILWQTTSVFIMKMLLFPFIISFLAVRDSSVQLSIFVASLFDFLGIPLLIQISYLGCNRRNVNVLISSFSIKKFVAILFDMKSAIVEPQRIYTISDTRNT
ncbi:Serpentine Receptor, class Z [Caenorhabditis elegans]|uniref:Serpentine Receptor, class Z n=1 Tax=Caenorhabditis elegans TaxID=6239 RepID=Q9XUH1_CAEEL|nr:Serpentine Receptor, class Z [Caenorhabditis elegans]CAB05140.1 Serpentine Receptor, class Z [Caenorhabditis elegans]|eukprot:NP_502464.1 Serpentine Receptor, class Z [Caenorhabditis elegans]